MRKQKSKLHRKHSFSLDAILGRRPGLGQLVLLMKQLSVMLKAGVPITEGILLIEESATGNLKSTLRKIHDSIQSGRSLSNALNDYPHVFPALVVSTVDAGERSGTLDQSLENLAHYFGKQKELMEKVKGAMYYPMIVTIAAILLAMMVTVYVFPKLIPLFASLRQELPLTTRILIWVTQLVQDYSLTLLIGFCGGVVFLYWLLQQSFVRPLIGWIGLHLPIVKSLVRQVNLTQFNQTLATLLRSGLNIVEALEATQHAQGNYYFQRAIRATSLHVGQGNKISTSLAQFHGLFPAMVVRIIEVGEESGQLEESLAYLAEFYEAEVDVSVKSLTSTIEPLLLLVIGTGVAFLALAVITPIYQITGGVRG